MVADKLDYSKIKEIVSGWYHYTLLKLGYADKETKEMAEQRLLICDTCEIRSGSICSAYRSIDGVIGCGCPILPKSLSLSSKCPLNKW